MPTAPPEPVRTPRSARWTVDARPPIDWTRQEPRELERLLSQTIDAQLALFAAENVGLPIGTVDRSARPQILWRELLKKAATAGLLRCLIEEFANAPEHAGIAPQLREYL